MQKIDCVINVLGKPYQTALTLLSLYHHCGQHIDRLYVILDRGEVDFDSKLQSRIPNIVFHRPAQWLWLEPAKLDRLDDDAYRLSLRYQYAWEHSDKKFLFFTHNDCLYTDDIIRKTLDSIGDTIAAGTIGQCWNCPAHWLNLCDPHRYWDWRPDFPKLKELYETTPMPPGKMKRAYHNPAFSENYVSQPWPLPECRVNEWAMLVNLELARPITKPLGSAPPIGAYSVSAVALVDIGVAWFRAVSQLGYRATHVDLAAYVQHGPFNASGHQALLDTGKYQDTEAAALKILVDEYNW